MASPQAMPDQADRTWNRFVQAAGSPGALLRAAADLGAIPEADRVQTAEVPPLPAAVDPLAYTIALLANRAPGSAPGRGPAVPSHRTLPEPLRSELARMLLGIHAAEQARRTALARLPEAFTPSVLMDQFPAASSAAIGIAPALDFRRLLGQVDRPTLLQGMAVLAQAAEHLSRYLATASTLPSVYWRHDTPLGTVLVDTTGGSAVHELDSPLLVVDVGGDDRYVFAARRDSNRIAVLIDRGGNDVYTATVPGSDPSAGVLGYGILWDSAGDDDYRGGMLAQGAALFGAALHIDQGGSDRYAATAYAQGFAVAGWAVLHSAPAATRFDAVSHAQASAGSEGVAVLVDGGGDDRYTLSDAPLLFPSAQLADSNTSMGQGAGRGLRSDGRPGGVSTTGGTGLLLDVAGDDHYTAQVFAQGMGYHEGLGMLLDGGGQDTFEAAWYAMGAAAHNAAGLLVQRGGGDDHYSARHSAALGAAHDFSVAVFVDQGGDDDYRVRDLGIGAALDNSVALFRDDGGADRYALDAGACRGFGYAALADTDPIRRSLPGAGFFVDGGGMDDYPAHCSARNGTAWTLFPGNGGTDSPAARSRGQDLPLLPALPRAAGRAPLPAGEPRALRGGSCRYRGSCRMPAGRNAERAVPA